MSKTIKIATVALALTAFAVPSTSFARHLDRGTANGVTTGLTDPGKAVTSDPDINVRFDARRDPSNDR